MFDRRRKRRGRQEREEREDEGEEGGRGGKGRRGGGILCSDLEERQVHSVLSKLPASDKPQAPGSGLGYNSPSSPNSGKFN